MQGGQAAWAWERGYACPHWKTMTGGGGGGGGGWGGFSFIAGDLYSTHAVLEQLTSAS